MARNRVIYQSEALYVSNDLYSQLSGAHVQLERVQSANYDFNISREDINQFAQLAALDSISIDPPTVNLDASYYLTEGFNEIALGFYVLTGALGEGNFASGHLTTSSGKNFYITTVDEGLDANGLTGVKSIIGLGNGFLTDYTVDLSVGAIPTATFSIEASNMFVDTAMSAAGGTISGITSPAVQPTNGTPLGVENVQLPVANTGQSTNSVTALRPGDVTIDLTPATGAGGSGQLPINVNGSDGAHVQSVSISVPLSRTPISRLGTKFPFARTVDFPVTTTLTVNAIINESVQSSLENILDTNYKSDLVVTLKDTNDNNRLVYTMKRSTLDSMSISSSIGANKSVDLTFSSQVGGPNDSVNGLFLSGSQAGAVFT